MDKLYSIEYENIEYETQEYEDFEEVFKKYEGLLESNTDLIIAYVGKHFAIAPNEKDKVALTGGDFQSHLLIELRLFNEEIEHYVTTRSGKLLWRKVKSLASANKGEEKAFIDKFVQLRKPKKSFNALTKNENDTLKMRHYIREDEGGYEILRFLKII